MSRKFGYSRFIFATTLFLLQLQLCGCGNSESKKPSTQVLAKINDTEITVSQLNYQLQELGASAGVDTSARAVLDSLVDEELLVQESLKMKLDRDPMVLQTLESARRKILANAYALRIGAPVAPIVRADEDEYFEKNPNLFANRKAFSLQAFSVEKFPADATLRQRLESAHTLDDVRAALNDAQVVFQEQLLERTADQLPLDTIEQFAQARIGDIVIVAPDFGPTLLLQVVNVTEQPLNLEQARPLIHEFLANRRKQLAVQDALKKLHAKTQIVYLGDFSTAPQLGSGGGESTPAAATGAVGASNNQHLTKGLSGIK